jgi:hypothetical protein
VLKNSTLSLILGGAAPGPQHARFWRDGVERFTAAMSGLFSVLALQIAEKILSLVLGGAAVHRCDNRIVFSGGFSR